MKMVQVDNKEDARQQAIDWQAWQAEQALSYGEMIEWQDYFIQLADRFNLISEFNENGII